MRDRKRGVISEIPQRSHRCDEMIAQCLKRRLFVGRMTRRLEEHGGAAILVVFKVQGNQDGQVIAERSTVSSENPTDFLVDDLCEHLPCDLGRHIDAVTTRIVPIALDNFQTRYSMSPEYRDLEGEGNTRVWTLFDEEDVFGVFCDGRIEWDDGQISMRVFFIPDVCAEFFVFGFEDSKWTTSKCACFGHRKRISRALWGEMSVRRQVVNGSERIYPPLLRV